jgi:hypothetical protein
VEKRFEMNHFKVRKSLAYVEMGELADGSTDRYMRSESELMGVYRNFYYYELCLYAQKDEECSAPKKKRKATNDDGAAPEAGEKKWMVMVNGLDQQPFMRLHNKVNKWLDDETLRTYEVLTFAPPPATCGKDHYNTWHGFLVERFSAPTDEDCSSFTRGYCHLSRILFAPALSRRTSTSSVRWCSYSSNRA